LTPEAAFVHTRPSFHGFFGCLGCGRSAGQREVVAAKARRMPQWLSLSHRSSLCAAAALLMTACGGGGFLGMGGGGSGQLCLELHASKKLNLFDGQPHALVVYFYPLSNVTGFEATSVRDLIRGAKPDGLAGESWRTTVLPGQTLKQGSKVPPLATHIAVVADYYAGPSRVIVPTSCEDDGQIVTLSSSEAVASAPDGKGEEKSDE
jgi:type VI secretion system VasD/TssJ family lipoprotein